MTLVELDRALRQLRLSGMARVLETRLRQAQTERLVPLDLVSTLVNDELLCRQDRKTRHRHRRLRRCQRRGRQQQCDDEGPKGHHSCDSKGSQRKSFAWKRRERLASGSS